MQNFKEKFEQELIEYKEELIEDDEEYDGTMIDILVPENFTDRLRKELIECCVDWLDVKRTGTACLSPISKITWEFDSGGYLYAHMLDKSGSCSISEGSSPSLWDWGLITREEDEYAFEGRQNLVAVFLANCFQQVIEDVCQSAEFLNLPREEKISMTVGAHGGWQCDKLYVFTGERHEIDYGNVRLKTLAHDADCHTKEGTAEHDFMTHVRALDVQQCADELLVPMTELLEWLVAKKPEPIDRIVIAWSSNFDKETAFGGINDDNTYKWNQTFDLSKWFSKAKLKDLDAGEHSSVRYAVSNKIAQIACLASERLIECDAFKKMPKVENFTMKVSNRTAGSPPRFYPFD